MSLAYIHFTSKRRNEYARFCVNAYNHYQATEHANLLCNDKLEQIDGELLPPSGVHLVYA